MQFGSRVQKSASNTWIQAGAVTAEQEHSIHRTGPSPQHTWHQPCRPLTSKLAVHNVSQHHLSGTQAALGHHVGGIGDLVAQHTDLRGHVDGVVSSAPEACGAQAVAVEAGADAAAVGEDQQRGAVPALLQTLVELIEVHDLHHRK